MRRCWLPPRWQIGFRSRLRRARLVLTATITWAVTGAASLASEAERIRAALDAGDLPAARAVLPSLCGRDPGRLGNAEMARAVIESVAENTSDGAVAPLLWGAVAGPGGLAAYRAVNTLDSMVGYRSPRYARFGWASARLDDVANWAPARLPRLAGGGLRPGSRRQPARRMAGDAHVRPAASQPERGPLRGCLRRAARHPARRHQRLRRSNREPAVARRRAGPGPADIGRAVRLSRAVTIGATALAALASMILQQMTDSGGSCAGPASAPVRGGARDKDVDSTNSDI